MKFKGKTQSIRWAWFHFSQNVPSIMFYMKKLNVELNFDHLSPHIVYVIDVYSCQQRISSEFFMKWIYGQWIFHFNGKKIHFDEWLCTSYRIVNSPYSCAILSTFQLLLRIQVDIILSQMKLLNEWKMFHFDEKK